MSERDSAAQRPRLDKQPHEVSAMFDRVAPKYDLLNTILAFGQEGAWRRATTQALELPAGARVLDLAAGTGTSTAALRQSGLDAIAADFSEGMMAEGRKRYPDIEFVKADAMALPFADNEFDGATMSFGLRNVKDHRVALAELARVVRPGGVVVICEFSGPTNPVFAKVYFEYLMRALPRVSGLFSSDPSAYEYLADSIVAWPRQEELRQDMLAAGFMGAQYRNLSGGIVALHRGYVPR
ncbi:class I SAM-dependent methyltransferase [Dermabacteraceae bacterium P13095]